MKKAERRLDILQGSIGLQPVFFRAGTSVSAPKSKELLRIAGGYFGRTLVNRLPDPLANIGLAFDNAGKAVPSENL